LLAAGAAAGLALAAASTLAPGRAPDALAPGEAARVNGVPIAGEALALALARVDSDRRGGLPPGERERVLDRLIDEELLVQRGAALGLVESDPAVRSALVQAVIASVVADAASAAPEERELAAFFAEHRRYFARPGRARVGRIFVRASPEAQARAEAALAALDAGEPFVEVKRRFGDAVPLELPEAPLPESKLRELLGPTLASAALALEPGAHTPVTPVAGGVAILVLLEREAERLPELEEVRAEVEAEWTRRAGERALGAYLSQLRREAEIARAADAAP
jgi:hypothetical protein